MLRYFASLTILILAIGAPANAAETGFDVDWQGHKIHFRDAEMNLFHGQTEVAVATLINRPSKPTIPCFFSNMKTTCRVLRKAKKDEPYGSNLEFEKPIAILPKVNQSVDLPDKLTLAYIRSLPDVVILPLSMNEKQEMANTQNLLGYATESHAYTPVDKTIGGDVAISTWQDLKQFKPNKDCLVDDFCTVVLPAQWGKSEAIAQCEIMNSKIGLGLPFNCNIVAVKREQWYVFSYDSPVQCDGCGAAEGASCYFETNISLENFVNAFQKAMKNGMTSIDMKIIKQSKQSGITLAGRNEATESKFFAGYFDRSYAIYNVTETAAEDGRPRTINLSGIFNLLISSEPTVNSVNYREFGTDKRGDTTNLEWFQERVLDIVKNSMSKQVPGKVDCEVQPIQ